MSADALPPEVAGALAPAAAPAVVGPPPAGEQVKAEQVNGALWRALLSMAMRVSGAKDSRESKECADATFALAQAITVLDRNVISPAGVTPDVWLAAQPQPQPQPSLEAQVTPDTGAEAREQGKQG